MKKAGLYIHIPFCLQKCNYCDFFSVKAGQFSSILYKRGLSPFTLRLTEDIRLQATKYGISEWDSVYIGGGTPSLLSAEDIYFIGSQILRSQKNKPKEFTIEANPEDLTKELLEAALSGGINRISVGIQSLSDGVLAACKRRGGRKTSLSALELVKSKKALLLSCDLIAGLKNQSLDVLEDDIKTLLNFKPEHFSLYALCSNTNISSEKEDKIAELWLTGKNLLHESNYRCYEVSNFSYKNLYKSIHNEKYWSLKDYVGVGPGAYGSIFFDKKADFPAHALRFSAVKNIHKWLSAEDRDKVYEYEDINEKEFIEEAFMMGLRLSSGMDRRSFKLRFEKDLTEVLEKTILRWTARGEAVLTDTNFYLTEKGSLFLNLFLQEAFEEIEFFFSRKI